MIELSELSAKLSTEFAKDTVSSKYKIKINDGTQPDFTEECFQLGYFNERSLETDRLLKANIIDTFDQEQIQGFEITIVSYVENYVKMWKALSKALRGWVPYPNEYNLSGFLHVSGDVVGISNRLQVSKQIWYLPFQVQTPIQ